MFDREKMHKRNIGEAWERRERKSEGLVESFQKVDEEEGR